MPLLVRLLDAGGGDVKTFRANLFAKQIDI